METTNVQVTPIQHGMLAATARLIEKLKDGKVGTVFTDEDLSVCCGRDTSVDGNGYGLLNSAMRNVLKNNNLVWERVRGAGCVKCLGPSEIAISTASSRKHIYKSAKRALRKAAVVNREELPADERSRFGAHTAQIGAIALFSNENTTKKLVARNIEKPPDPKALMEAFKRTEVR